MQLLAVVGIIAGLVALYFSLGIVLKFLLDWWIMIIAIPLCIYVGIAFEWSGAIGSLVGFVLALGGNNEWHSTRLYLAISKKIDKMFYFKDI